MISLGVFETLSCGQLRNRLQVACALWASPDVLVDEPTNHVNIVIKHAFFLQGIGDAYFT